MKFHPDATINWLHLIFLSATPVAALVLIPWYGFTYGYSAWAWLAFGVFMMGTGLGITAGYHRLWSHKTYKAHFLVRLWHACWGAAACQGSILKWSSDHRIHHRHVDHEEKDPYAATRGFLFSHIGWVVMTEPRAVEGFDNCKDLERDPIVRWQHKHFWKINIFMNGAVPVSFGLLVGEPLGFFLLAFLLRVVLNHHFTFFINSLAHMWGSRPYSDEDSSRDNMLLAMVTYGEGYHNFHHTFQWDYRNGIRWWHFDPGKWLIKGCSYVGLARNLKRASKVQIEKARAHMQLKRALDKMNAGAEMPGLRQRLEQKHEQLVDSLNEWATVQRKWLNMKKKAVSERFERIELRERYLEMKYAARLHRKQWRLLLAELATPA